MRKIIIDFFSPKSSAKKEEELLLERLEKYAIEQAMLWQYISDQFQKEYVDTCDTSLYLPSDELMDKYGRWIRKSNQRHVWGIVENYFKMHKEKKELVK